MTGRFVLGFLVLLAAVLPLPAGWVCGPGGCQYVPEAIQSFGGYVGSYAQPAYYGGYGGYGAGDCGGGGYSFGGYGYGACSGGGYGYSACSQSGGYQACSGYGAPVGPRVIRVGPFGGRTYYY